MFEKKRELLSVHPHALRGLHNIYGFDFQQPHTVLYMAGNYTVKKIEKAAAAAGYGTDAEIVLLTRSNGRRAWNRDFSVVEIRNGKAETDFSDAVRASFNYQLIPFDYFYCKGSFEEVRKDADAETYVFIQKREFLKKPEKKPVDFSQRFHLAQVRYSWTSNGSKKYVSSLELYETTTDGKRKIEYGERSRYYAAFSNRQEDTGELIDKSGYLLQERREDLKRRAAKLRAERAKAAFMAADNSAKVEELRGMIEARKNELVQQLQQATTAEAVREVEKALCTWKGLGGIMSDFERFERNSAAKKYASIEEADKVYNGIKNALRGEAA